jgi:hypothetical protein
MELRPDGSIDVTTPEGGHARFAPEFVIQQAKENPNLEMRWGKF